MKTLAKARSTNTSSVWLNARSKTIDESQKKQPVPKKKQPTKLDRRKSSPTMLVHGPILMADPLPHLVAIHLVANRAALHRAAQMSKWMARMKTWAEAAEREALVRVKHQRVQNEAVAEGKSITIVQDIAVDQLKTRVPLKDHVDENTTKTIAGMRNAIVITERQDQKDAVAGMIGIGKKDLRIGASGQADLEKRWISMEGSLPLRLLYQSQMGKMVRLKKGRFLRFRMTLHIECI